MSVQSVHDRIEALVAPVLESQGFELVDMEYRREPSGWVLRLFVDKTGGITLDDCADISREVGGLLDAEDLIDVAFTLEVSSPGLTRPLKKDQDFIRFAGRLVKLKTFQSVDPDQRGYARKTFVGTLVGLVDDQVVLDQNDAKGGRVSLDRADLAAANLEFDL
jgi:ribosome maturation factor RimP